jgi:hypothetical protein
MLRAHLHTITKLGWTAAIKCTSSWDEEIYLDAAKYNHHGIMRYMCQLAPPQIELRGVLNQIALQTNNITGIKILVGSDRELARHCVVAGALTNKPNIMRLAKHLGAGMEAIKYALNRVRFKLGQGQARRHLKRWINQN